jgi:hypothetical protein
MKRESFGDRSLVQDKSIESITIYPASGLRERSKCKRSIRPVDKNTRNIVCSTETGLPEVSENSSSAGTTNNHLFASSPTHEARAMFCLQQIKQKQKHGLSAEIYRQTK